MAEQAAIENWNRYMECLSRGHRDFQLKARRNSNFYFGDGRQWDPEVIEALNARGLPAFEYNLIKPAVDAAVGYQIHNRADVSYRPKGGEATTQKATTLSKLVMDILGRNDFHHIETDMFRDGLIQSRAFIDVRISYDKNRKGDIVIELLDPSDVIPDPDAKSYSPDSWGDVIITRWLTGDEIENLYGKKVRLSVEQFSPNGEADFGVTDSGSSRDKFGTDFGSAASMGGFNDDTTTIKRYRVIDRQRKVTKRQRCIVMNAGDFRPIDELSEEKLADLLRMGGSIRMMSVEKIKWTVSTRDVVLFDEWSPLSHFSVIMFAPFFMRGTTMGLVENAIDPQRTLNKAMSQGLHAVGQTSNSGWISEEGTIVNMDDRELEERGAENGLHIVVKRDAKHPTKITPNAFPPGFEQIIQHSKSAIREVTVPEAMTGVQGTEISGVAIQSRQFAAQQQLATPLDYLNRTRRILARNILDYVQRYYSGAREISITGIDPITGQSVDNRLVINTVDPMTGGIMNDITNGEYDVEITENPEQITFDNSQFTQIMEMREKGIQIPDTAAIRHSNLADKYDILREMDQAKQSAPPDPALQAKVALMQAQAAKLGKDAQKVAADAAQVGATTVYTLTQAAMGLSTNAQLVPAIDELGKSVGFQDQNGGNILDGPVGGIDAPPPLMPKIPDTPLMPKNGGMGKEIPMSVHTHPALPGHVAKPISPVLGHQQGIETPQNNQ